MGAKISSEKFNHYFSSAFGKSNSGILAGPQFGVDVSLVQISPNIAMASASDPLSYIPSLGAEKSAWLSVHLNANDIATTSVLPQYFQVVLNLPESLEGDIFKEYWFYLDKICRENEVSITGGHTAFLPGINSTVAGGGTMSSVGETSKFLLSNQAQEGDLILMSKQAAITSTAILGLSFPDKMTELLGDPHRNYFEKLFYQNTLQKEGRIASVINENKKCITAMHDVTEGGVMGAVYEMSHASGLGVELNLSEVKVDDIQRKICTSFGISPYEIIGAGSMLMSVKPQALNGVLERYEREELNISVIGRFTKKGGSRSYYHNGTVSTLNYIEQDPYWEAYYKTVTDG